MKKTDVRYLTVSNTIIYCEKCGKRYVGGKFDDKCKFCGSSEIVKYSKITGYLAPIDKWNDGKLDEFYRRAEFKLF